MNITINLKEAKKKVNLKEAKKKVSCSATKDFFTASPTRYMQKTYRLPDLEHFSHQGFDVIATRLEVGARLNRWIDRLRVVFH